MNKNKSLPFIIGALVIIVSLGVVFSQQSSKSTYVAPSSNTTVDTTPVTTPTSSNTKPTTINTTNTTPGGYTLADVAKHNNRSDCWTTINGSVYNVTSWIDQHPGGAEAIISLCGIDGSDAFNGQHGGQRRPASELASFKIGVLK